MTDSTLAPLLTPFTAGGLRLRNRIVMAPMTRCCSPAGVPGADVAAYYRRRAEHEVGLIVTEGTWIPHASASNEANAPDFFGEAALAGWKRVCDEVHAAGAKIVPQLWHVGLTLKPVLQNIYDEQHATRGIEPRHFGPSGIAGGFGYSNEPGHRVMTQADIDAVIDAYATAAAHARRLGFDGVELHAAHGYLIDQFFWHETNRRADAYGDSLANRARFGAEIVAEIRRRTAPDFPVILRISQWKQHDFGAQVVASPVELGQWLAPLVDAGVDLFHCSQRRYWEPAFAGSDLNLAGWAKQVTGKPTITVGSVTLEKDLWETVAGDVSARHGVERLIAMLERGDFDLVAVGRALIADPDWIARMRAGGHGALTPYSVGMLAELR